MKIYKKILIVFLILIILLYSIIPPKIIYADEDTLNSSAEAGQIIANFAIDMVQNHASETIYDYGNAWGSLETNYGRIKAYEGVKVTGYAQSSSGETRHAENKFFMDCVGFVNFCIHHSLGIEGAGDKDKRFVVPQAIRSNDFEDVTGSDLQPGDIIYTSGHVMIYVSDGRFAESSDINNPTWQIKFRTSYPDSYSVARIKESTAKSILKADTKDSFDGQSENGENGGNGGNSVQAPEVDDSDQFDIYVGNATREDSNKFYYNGIPKSGQYLGETKEENWLFEKLENAADWLLGVITLDIKVQAIGWANIFEGVANNVVEGISSEDLSKRITVEDVIYNRVPILDVNIFDFKQAGGEEIGEDSIIYILKENVASWYVVVRTIAIIFLLFTLLYLGIKTAISSVAKDKAEYKQKLTAWLVSFIIVMFIHYFMIIVLQLNQIMVSWVTPEGDTSAVYELMREYAFEISATKGWTGTIIYVFLVYYLIKMLLFYFKRLLITYILAIISPAMGVVYSIQRINGKSKALGIWMKDFAFNVLIQFVHAVTYTILMSIILKFTSNATAFTIVPYAIILFVLLNFLLNAEDIIKNIFKIQSLSLKRVLDTVFDIGGKLAIPIAIAKIGYSSAKTAVVNSYDKKLTASLNQKYDKYKIQGDSELAQNVNSEIERLKQQEMEHTKELDSNAINFAKNTFSGVVATVAAVPALYEKPLAGAASMIATVTTYDDHLGRGKAGYAADELNKSTEGIKYIYIDEPTEEENNNILGQSSPSGINTKTNTANNTTNVNKGRANLNTTNGNSTNVIGKNNTSQGGKNTTNSQNNSAPAGNNGTQQQTIRTYNTKKNRKYCAPKALFSWATLGRSTMAENVLREGEQEELIKTTVYRTRIEKLSIIGNRAVKEVKVLNKELYKIKDNSYPPIYYTPKDGETKGQIEMNERLREKYRDILQKNVVQLYEGVNKDKVSEKIINYKGNKITMKSIEEITKDYLSENECSLGAEFDNNLNEVLREKIMNTAQNKNGGFEKMKLNPELEEKITDAIKDSVKNKEKDKQKVKEKLNKEVDKIVTPKVRDEIVSKLSTNDLISVISKTLEKKESIKIHRDFKNLEEPIENLRKLNQEFKVTSGKEMYSTEKIIDLIMNKDIME